jgi:hypothetical protein
MSCQLSEKSQSNRCTTRVDFVNPTHYIIIAWVSKTLCCHSHRLNCASRTAPVSFATVDGVSVSSTFLTLSMTVIITTAISATIVIPVVIITAIILATATVISKLASIAAIRVMLLPLLK